MSPADIEEESKDPPNGFRDCNVMNLSNHNQVIIKCLFILNTVFTVLACLGLYLTDLSICVCVCKCSHVW